MSRVLKIALPIVLALVVSISYMYYASAKQQPESYILMAKTDIKPGDTIKQSDLELVPVMGKVEGLQADKVVNEKAGQDIKAREIVTEDKIRGHLEADERLYTIAVDYTTGNGPVIKPGMTVEVWKQATKETKPAFIGEATIYQINVRGEGSSTIAPDTKTNVTLKIFKNQIELFEIAKAEASLFLVAKGGDNE